MKIPHCSYNKYQNTAERRNNSFQANHVRCLWFCSPILSHTRNKIIVKTYQQIVGTIFMLFMCSQFQLKMLLGIIIMTFLIKKDASAIYLTKRKNEHNSLYVLLCT